MTALYAVALVVFIIVALLVISPRHDDKDDGTVVGFPADRKNRR
jgi:hypothetical protein